jgi:hypothetical protein
MALEQPQQRVSIVGVVAMVGGRMAFVWTVESDRMALEGELRWPCG